MGREDPILQGVLRGKSPMPRLGMGVEDPEIVGMGAETSGEEPPI